MKVSDGNVMEKLAKLKAQDKSLWQKIKDFISELAAKIRTVYEGMSPDSVEGRYVADMVDSIERLQELFTEGLVDASENYQSSLTPGEESIMVNENGDPVAYSTEDMLRIEEQQLDEFMKGSVLTDGQPLYSDRDITEDPLYPETERERGVFNREFANKISGLKPGETRDIMITTADYFYFARAYGTKGRNPLQSNDRRQ